ncbi:MAG TPA: PAS domain S-box protein [Methanospirillum sp.]|nr:PAS domain S-box protein [Methanospirillum sp.]
MLQNWRLSRVILGSILSIVFFVVAGVIISNYLVMIGSVTTETIILKNNSEEMINTSFRLVNTGLEIYDGTYNEKMKDAFILVIDAYNQSAGNPALMNLEALKNSIHGMEIHIINSSGVIEYSSNVKDLGLDFSIIYPDFYQYQNRIRPTHGFYPDRVVMEYYTGNLTKYAYMPTPDHQYLLELALRERGFDFERMQLQYDTVMRQVQASNPYIEQYRIFAKNKRLVYNQSYVPTDTEISVIDQILRNRTSMSFYQQEKERTVKYLLVDMKDERYGADMSLIVEIFYNDSRIRDQHVHLLLYHLILALIAIIVGAILSVAISRRLTRPIEWMVEDIDCIADGNLDHTIRAGMSLELRTLQESAIRMVTSIRSLITNIIIEEKKVQESEQRYRNVIETQTELICRFRPDGVHIFVNDAYCRFFGKSSDDILGTQFIPGMPVEVISTVGTHFSSLTCEHPTGTQEQLVYAADGSLKWLQWNDKAIYSPSGEVLEYQSVGRDITGLKHLQENLLASDLLYRSTINAMVDGVHVIDRTYTILLFNHGFDTWFEKLGIEKGVIIGRNLFDIFPFLGDTIRSQYEEVFASGEMVLTEETQNMEGFTIITETRKIPIIISGSVEKIVTIIRDVTNKRVFEDALRNMNRVLETEVRARTEELEAMVIELDSFTYTVSHDLRGPIRAIDGFAHILSLKADPSLSSDLSYYLTKIFENVTLMDQLIEDLLTFSRMSRQPIERAPIPMRSLAMDIARETASLYPTVRFDLVIDDLPAASGDPILIRQVLVNLISNAMKFSHAHHNPSIHIGYTMEDQTVVYFVSDNGIGFDMEYNEKIFDVFQRLHPAGEFEGTGVGLAIVKRIIIRHGGLIRARSDPGVGSVFSFTIGGTNGTE